jgi:hypothetical protein
MQRLRESLTILLLGLLPFHAFLVTTGTNVIAGSGNAPLTMLALWKEAFLGVILVLATLEIFDELIKRKTENEKRKTLKLDILDILVLSMITNAFVLFFFHFPLSTFHFLIGFKYDFIPLIAFIVLRRVQWSDFFLDRVFKVILIAAGIIAVYGIIGMYLPQEFFSWLGYGDLHSLYQSDAPLAAFQQIGGTAIRRIQSTMSGPNQLGLWLLIPLSILLTGKKVLGSRFSVLGPFVLFAMLLTLSRSAVLAAGVMVAVVLWQQLPRKKFFQFAGVLFCFSFVLSIASYFFASDVVLRAASTSDHISRPIEAMHTIIKNPLGLGLGTAGPASNRVSDTCVYLEEGDDPSWAQEHPNLCVFVGESQVQSKDGACMCPVLPENWYLQMGVEMGILGMVLFLMLVFILLRKLSVVGNRLSVTSPVFLAFLGISIAALFLHAWEDAAVAYTVWLLVAISLPRDQ